MPINFTSLFQDSWNFMRNQKTLVYRFLFIYALFSLGGYLFSSTLFGDIDVNINSEQALQNVALTDFATVYILQQAIFLLINCWAMRSVHQISQGQNFNLGLSFSQTLQKFIGVAALYIILVLPLVLVVMDILSSLLTQKSPSAFALPGMIIAIFVFIRLFLAPISYLLGDQPWAKTIGFIWQCGVKRTGTLLLFCLITQFLFGLIAQQLNALAGNPILALIASVLLAGLNLFSIILTYRFYSLFTQKN